MCPPLPAQQSKPAAFSDSSATPVDRRARSALAIAVAAVVITPSLYSFHFMSFSDAKLAGLAVGALVLSVVVPVRGLKENQAFMFTVPLFLWVLWGTAIRFFRQSDLTIGAHNVDAAYISVLSSFLIISTALRLAPALVTMRTVAASALPVAALALGQYARVLPGLFPVFAQYTQRMYSVFGNQDLLGGFVATSFVVFFSLWLRREVRTPAALTAVLVLVPILLLSGCRSAWVAALAGVTFAVLQDRGQWKRASAAGAVVFACALTVAAATPSVTVDRISGSLRASDIGFRIRLWIWDGAFHLIRQFPLTGAGGGEFIFRSPRALGEVLHARGPGYHMFNHVQVIHAHSDPLDILVETGMVGAVLIAVFLTLIPRRRSAAWPGLMAAFAFSLVNSTLHSPSHVLTILLLADSLRRVPAPAPALGVRSKGLMERAAAISLAGIAAIFVGTAVLIPSTLYARALASYSRDSERAVEANYTQALAWSRNLYAYEDRAVILANDGRIRDAYGEAIQASGLDTGGVHFLQARLAELDHASDRARASYRACLLRWPDHLPAYQGLLRTTSASERDAILAEARRWLPAEDYAELTSVAAPPSPAR